VTDSSHASVPASAGAAEVRTRFAPSPSGDLHVGNIRTAIYCWAYARRTVGTFVFRIEDTDKSRAAPEYVHAVIETMRWLGLDWDEGPEVGGGYGPYLQSQRMDIYREWGWRFLEQGDAYHCYCTPEELEERREKARAEGRPPGYDGRCRDLTPGQRQAFEAEGRKPVLRFRMPPGKTTFVDLVRGEVTFEHEYIPDFVLARADGSPLYTLAVAVDDVLMKITHVVRGEDLLSSTPRQLAVYRAMGVAESDLPKFAHLPFVMGPDNTKLSKRHGATTIGAFRQRGYLPEAMCNYLALLGWSPGDDREFFSLAEMTREFDLARVNASSARFDVKKLDAINGDWIRALAPADFETRLVPFLQHAGLVSREPTDEERQLVHGVAPLIQERVAHLTEAAEMVGFLFVDDARFTIDPKAAGRLLTAETRAALEAGRSALGSLAEWKAPAIESALRAALVDGLGLKPKHAFGPVRVAVTGRRVSPPLFESLALLGRDRTLARIDRALVSMPTG
jgi:glutamyl-tRNA synthetase